MMMNNYIIYFFAGYFSCLISGVLISTHNLIVELILHKIRVLKHERILMENSDKFYRDHG